MRKPHKRLILWCIREN